MLKSLYPQVEWDVIRWVGFDLDGTLYDECDFIGEVYADVAELIARETGREYADVYTFLLRRWVVKGSSYARIFREALERFRAERERAETLELACVECFRNWTPTIRLNLRVQTLLDHFKECFELFIVTDGGEKLQQAKLDSLGLDRWIRKDRTAITSRLGSGGYKPSCAAAQALGFSVDGADNQQVVFFGDREVDQKFAHNAGFQFQLVKVMQPNHLQPSGPSR